MPDEKIAFCSDSSEFSRQIEGEIAELGFGISHFELADDLDRVLDDSCACVVVVNPRLHQAKAVRKAMRNTGGWTSRAPLLAALEEAGQMTEMETLKHFDDFIGSPAGAVELLARVSLVSARRQRGSRTITHGDLVINMDARQVTVAGRPVDLTFKEYELLKTITATPGRAYSREELLKNIWGYDYFGGTRTVDVHIRRLRSKLEAADRCIETVHGVGYRFTPR